MKTYTYPMD